MKAILICVFSMILASESLASERELVGQWVLTPQTQERLAPACRGMTLEFTADDRIVRETGELIYTTSVIATADGAGWLLKEELQSQNSKPGCGGKSAGEIVSHLQHRAYVEVHGLVLRYYGSKDGNRVMEFKRSDAQQARVHNG